MIRTARRKKNSKKQDKDRLRSLWDNFKHTNIQIIGVPEGEEEKQEIESLFEKIMKEKLLSGLSTGLQTQGSWV